MTKKHDKQASATDKLQEETLEALGKSEAYIHKNRRNILIGVIVAIVVIGGVLAYKYLYADPREDKAYEEMFRAEHYFNVDSFSLALNGNGADVVGFQEILDNYGGTKAANLAQAYAGICYYHLGEYQKAIAHLKKHKAKDIMLQPTVIGLIGDCQVELGNHKEAVKQFEEAAKVADNNVISPIYLLKAGIAYEALGEKDKALNIYKQIQEQYYNSPQATEAEKLSKALSL